MKVNSMIFSLYECLLFTRTFLMEFQQKDAFNESPPFSSTRSEFIHIPEVRRVRKSGAEKSIRERFCPYKMPILRGFIAPPEALKAKAARRRPVKL